MYSFVVYDLSSMDTDTFDGQTSSLDSLFHLDSFSELRDLLLSYAREELEDGDLELLEFTLQKTLDLTHDYDLTDEAGKRAFLDDMLNTLELTDDDDIDCTIWWFSREVLYLKKEETDA